MNGPQHNPATPDPQAWPEPSATTADPASADPRATRPRPQQPPISAYDPRYKSPLVASFLSIFPGVGQIYVGYYLQGFTHAAILAGVITMLASNMNSTFRPLLGIFLAFFWLYNVIDAGRRAALYNHALRDGAAFDVPQMPTLTPGGGSMAGGIALIVVGTLFLMYTALDISMDWLEDWWPLGPIAFGVYLVYKALNDKREARPAR